MTETDSINNDYKSFYDERRHETYAHDYENMRAEDHGHYLQVKEFIEKYQLADKKCLEIGSSGGFFQDMVNDYTGADIAESLAKYYHKPYKVIQGTQYPFDDEIFDAIWTITVYEHIPHLATGFVGNQEAVEAWRRVVVCACVAVPSMGRTRLCCKTL